MKRNKIKETQEIIKDLSAIITACNSTIQACTLQSDYDLLKKELVITYEERERQYNRLKDLQTRVSA